MKSKHTKGKAIIYNPSKILNKEESIGIDVDGISVLVFGSRPSSDTTGEEDLANAQLMVDAFNVTNETNKTPRELQKSHDELLEAAEMFFDRMPTDWGDLIFNGRLTLNIDADAVDAIESAIKNATK
jgi:hypothetical protein